MQDLLYKISVDGIHHPFILNSKIRLNINYPSTVVSSAFTDIQNKITPAETFIKIRNSLSKHLNLMNYTKIVTAL
jgi:hypothetical protein